MAEADLPDMTAALEDDVAGNAASSAQTQSGLLREIFDLAKVVMWALAIAMGLRITAYEPFNIPSESMLPGLMIGDYLLVAKYPYGYSRHSVPFGLPLFKGRILGSAVTRGDVAVFKWPNDNRTDYIKRIIGLPGDKLQMLKGTLYINGAPVRRKMVVDFKVWDTPNSTCGNAMSKLYMYRRVLKNGQAVCIVPQYREYLPEGRSFLTLDLLPFGPADTTSVFTVPAGHYFAMGDNRDDSEDSRIGLGQGGVGFVPAENLVGRAEILFFSTDGTASLADVGKWRRSMRSERVFKKIK
jgi:signal peptidase I